MIYLFERRKLCPSGFVTFNLGIIQPFYDEEKGNNHNTFNYLKFECYQARLLMLIKYELEMYHLLTINTPTEKMIEKNNLST